MARILRAWDLAAILGEMTLAVIWAVLVAGTAAAADKPPAPKAKANQPAAKAAPAAQPSAALPEDKAFAALLERARNAARARERKAFLECLTSASRDLFARVFPGDSWEPADLAGRSNVKLLEFRKHPERPWAMLVVPGKSGQGQDVLFARKEGGRWLLDQQHPLLVWDTVQAIMRSQKGERREKATLDAPTLLTRQLLSSHLPEGWSAEDPAAEDDWRHLPAVQEAFFQRLSGPREKTVKAKFVLFSNTDEAEWELWRRKMEFGFKADLHHMQPSLGDGAAYGKHSNINYELLVRKGSTLLILYANSEDVVPIGQRVAERF